MWAFLKMGLTSPRSSAVATLMNRMTSCMMVMARITIMTLPYDLPRAAGRPRTPRNLETPVAKIAPGP